MELRNLSTFVTVTESGSFTKAAETLGYTQSTVSFQIRQLEEELNCQLFDRINHTISLTAKGQQLLTFALDILHSTENFIEDFAASDRPAGVVRVYSSDSISEKMLTMNYHNFRKEYPEIKLEFVTADTVTMADALDHNEADVIFTLDKHIYRKDYVTVREAPVRVRFVANSSSPLAQKEHVAIEEILECPLLLTEKGMSYRAILDDALAQHSLQAVPVMETGRTDLIAKIIAQGDGIAYLPEFVTEEYVRNGSLTYLNAEEYECEIWKQLIYHKNKYVSGALAAFIQYVRDNEFEW